MLPFVVIHNAVSVDGRTDWFTPNTDLHYELAALWPADALLVGSQTVYDPSEPLPPEDPSTARPQPADPSDTRPLLVVPDSRGRVRNWHVLRSWGHWRDLVALCSRVTPREYLDYLLRLGVNAIVAGDDHVDLRAALEELHARYRVRLVRVDSGGTLSGVLLRAGLVDEVSVVIHPTLVGGLSPRSFYRAPDLASPDDVIPLRLTHAEALAEEYVWLRYEVVRPSNP